MRVLPIHSFYFPCIKTKLQLIKAIIYRKGQHYSFTVSADPHQWPKRIMVCLYVSTSNLAGTSL